ncbi:hypothetical protein IIA79_03365 [bacterium]|nr:hypothetical protein [bacterium]
MHPRLHLHLRDERLWHLTRAAATRGRAFTGEDLLDAPALAKRAGSCANAAAVEELLQSLNGFFAMVACTADGAVVAAVDRVRSIPLFYGINNGALYLSNDAYWVKDAMESSERDPLCETEFMLAGYVLGSDTLVTSVKQVQAGELVVFDLSVPQVSKDPRRYYRYRHTYTGNPSEEELLGKLDSTMEGVFRRLTKLAEGRTIVVPLSGGYDSRLVVLMLKRMGYGKVITFSYGRPRNTDALISREIAKRLGYHWEFVLYDVQRWRHWVASPEWREYCRFAENLCSVPHIQDWPTVLELKRTGRIPADALFVPGLTGLSGGLLSELPKACQNGPADAGLLVSAVFSFHYKLWDWQEQRSELEPQLRERILAQIGDLSQFPDTFSAFESQAIDGDKAKLNINSLRVYEFFGHDWWIPLWDLEFMQFWTGVPVHFRRGRALYSKYVMGLSRELTGVGVSIAGRSTLHCAVQMARGMGKRLPLLSASYRAIKRLLNVNYYIHPLAWYGLVPPRLFRKLHRGNVNINSFLALERLGRITFVAKR